MPQVITGVNPLNTNAIYTALYNMVISQEVFGGNIKGTYSTLVDRAKVDVGLYGDQKWFYSCDALGSHRFIQDSAEQLNVLKTHRPKAPEVQNIVIDQFFQIPLTLDNYLSKQAWGTEGAFSQFNSIMMGWMNDTKRIIDSTTYNSFIGTNETGSTDEDDLGYKQKRTIDAVPDQNTALTVAVDLADLLVELKDVSRDYNDYGHIRSYDENDLIVVFNAKIWNQLKKADLPVIFHNEGLLDEFEKVNLPARYFGTIVDVNNHSPFAVPQDALQTYRTLIELDVMRDGQKIHLFPADEVKFGDTFLNTNPEDTANYMKNYNGQIYEDEVYMEDDKIVYKVMHKRSVPYMSAFTTTTTFKNASNLSENYYLTFGRNSLEHLKNYPFITARFNG